MWTHPGVTFLVICITVTALLTIFNPLGRDEKSRPCSEFGDRAVQSLPARCHDYWVRTRPEGK